MATKGSNNVTANKGSFQIVDVGQFIRFSDGSKLSAAKTETGSASVSGANPTDVGQYRLYESSGTLYLCLKDLTAPNPLGDSNLAGYRIMATLGSS